METIEITLKYFQEISHEENPTGTLEMITKIKEGLSYIIVGNKSNYHVIFYQDADGREILGMNKWL